MNTNDFPVQSLLETDFYKISMAQFFFHNYPTIPVKVEWKCRGNEKLGFLKEQLDEFLDYFCSLRFKQEEIDYLKQFSWFTEDFLNYLLRWYPLRHQIKTGVDENGQLTIVAEGPEIDVIHFEIPVLAAVSEYYMRHTAKEQGKDIIKLEEEGIKNVDLMIDQLKACYADGHKFTFADFGLRRRFSRDYQEKVVKRFIERAPEFFVGTSNVLLAKQLGVKPIGTFAHESYMALQNHPEIPIGAVQRKMLDGWAKEYRGDLGIALSDIFGFRAFLRDFDKYYAKLFDGCRHDSGDPIIWGNMLIEHYKKLGIDPTTKVGCWSDSLNAQKCVDIAKTFSGRIKVSFGVGTAITNSTPLKPLNMVMKLVEANGKPCVKLSDSLGKSMCHDESFIEYVKQQYNYKSIDDKA